MTTTVDGLLKFTRAEYTLEGDVLTVYLPKNFSMFKKRITAAKKDLLLKFGARKLRIDVIKKEEVKLDLNTIDVEVIDLKNLDVIDRLLYLVANNEFMSIDFETDSMDARTTNVISAGLCFSRNKDTFYIPVDHTEANNTPLEVLMEFLRTIQHNVKFVCHNMAFEKKILDRYSVFPEYIDTMILTYLKGGLREQGLKHVASKRLGVHMKTFEEVVGKGKEKKRFNDIDVSEAAQYCGSDALYTAKLLDLLYDTIDSDLIILDHNAALACINMETRGVLIDPDYYRHLSARYERRLQRIEKVIYLVAGHEFNIRSTKQLQTVLFDEMGVVPLKTKKAYTEKGALSTSKEVIEGLFIENPDNKLLKYLCEYRSVSVYLNSFSLKMVDLADENNILRGSFLYARTSTGRLASSEPNMQNMPGSGIGSLIREGIISPPGYTVVAGDYSQIEYRLLAHLMKDTNLINTIKAGHDIHTATAALMFGSKPEDVTKEQRGAGKTLNFGLVYGRSDKAVAADLRITVKEAKRFKQLYFDNLTSFIPLRDSVWQSTAEKGYSETMLGRRRYLPDMRSNNKYLKASAERQAFNAVIQGSAADLIRETMYKTDLLSREFDSKLVMSVHDELVFYVKDEQVEAFKKRLKEVMEVSCLGTHKFDIPIIVDIGEGRTYLDAK